MRYLSLWLLHCDCFSAAICDNTKLMAVYNSLLSPKQSKIDIVFISIYD